MDWVHTAFRRLYQTGSDPAWMRLPLYTRALGAELVRWVDDEGRLYLRPGEDHAQAVVRVLSGEKRDLARVRSDLQTLAAPITPGQKDPYLTLENGALAIRNFQIAQGVVGTSEERAAQKSKAAVRAAKWRAEKKGLITSVELAPTTKEERSCGVRERFANGSPNAFANAFAKTYADVPILSCPDPVLSPSHLGGDPSAEVSPSAEPAPSAALDAPAEPTDAKTIASASGCHQDELSTPRTHVEPSDASGRATEAPRAAGEAPANCTQDSPLGAWRALGELAGDEVDGIDPRRLVSKLDMAVNAACAWYPKAAEIPRAWLAQRLAGKLASHVADRPASSPDQRLAVLVKSIEYVVGDVRNKRANPFEAPVESPQQRPARPPPMSFAERDEQRRLDASLSGLEALANEGTYGRS